MLLIAIFMSAMIMYIYIHKSVYNWSRHSLCYLKRTVQKLKYKAETTCSFQNIKCLYELDIYYIMSCHTVACVVCIQALHST